MLIVGAGLAGIGAAVRLRQECPERSFALLEARQSIGGTWDLFRYPGIRSDSDMYTLGYPFKPWRGSRAITGGATILDYVRETADEFDIEPHIRFGCKVSAANFSSAEAIWRVSVVEEVEGRPVGVSRRLSCRFLLTCSGYYRYDQGYEPQIAGRERFEGRIVHPQHWPEDLDCAGKRVTVVGSGATAITLVPALAASGAQVTMLQRSPTYLLTLPSVDALARAAARLLPERAAYRLIRGKNVMLAMAGYQLARSRPRLVRRLIDRGVRRQLPAGYDVERHFQPRYEPWDQRLCIVADGDLFKAIAAGSAEVVTDRIASFGEHGLLLQSGAELPAEVIVLATGLNLLAFGGIDLSIDGEPVNLPERLAYRGMMVSGVPNFAFVIGYVNASWTLRADLTSRYVCRILNRMSAEGATICMPVETDQQTAREPILDLTAGYVKRSIDSFPKQGARRPWKMRQNYLQDLLDMRRRPGESDSALRFFGSAKAAGLRPAADGPAQDEVQIGAAAPGAQKVG